MADTSILSWLGRASMCGDVDIERSAEMLKNYYQGIGPEPEYQEVGQSNDRQMTVKQDSDGWPGEIYLQAGDDPLSHFSEYDEVSWCDHPQGESDVRYVRADEPIAALASRPAELDDWISVEDRLPEDGTWQILIWGGPNHEDPEEAYYRNGFWTIRGDERRIQTDEPDNPTHWMPMPPAPQFSTNKEK